MTADSLWRRSTGAWQRRAASWFWQRPFRISAGTPIVSFTFDDFPRSAFLSGGTMLERIGARATYYVSLGLAGMHGPEGEHFRIEDLTDLLFRGHELGCHTFDHCPAWPTKAATFEASVIRNAAALAAHAPAAAFRTLSYPINNPRPATKRRMSELFDCCRGGGQTFNVGTVDLNYLKAFFLEQCGEDIAAVRSLLAETRAAGGWLIFATHDIAPHPSQFGCTPEFFEAVVAAAAESRATILPVHAALQALQRRARSCPPRPLAQFTSRRQHPDLQRQPPAHGIRRSTSPRGRSSS